MFLFARFGHDLRLPAEARLQPVAHIGQADPEAVAGSRRYARPIVTEVKAATAFWPAENYHQRYLQKGGQSAEKNAPEKVRCYG